MKTIKIYNGLSYILIALFKSSATAITATNIADIDTNYYDFIEFVNIGNINCNELYLIALTCFKSTNLLDKVNLKRFKKQLEIVINKLSWLQADDVLYDIMYA